MAVWRCGAIPVLGAVGVWFAPYFSAADAQVSGRDVTTPTVEQTIPETSEPLSSRQGFNLPNAIPFATLRERLIGHSVAVESVHDFESVWVEYARDFNTARREREPDVLKARERYDAAPLSRLWDLKALYAEWRGAVEVLDSIDLFLWERLRGFDVPEPALQRLAAERSASVWSIRGLDRPLPELRVTLIDLLNGAGVCEADYPEVSPVVMTYLEGRAAGIRDRTKTFARVLDDRQTILDAHQFSRRTAGSWSDADAASLDNHVAWAGNARLREVNAGLAKLLRRAVEDASRTLPPTTATAFTLHARRVLYPEVFSVADPVEELASQAGDPTRTAAIEAMLVAYRARRDAVQNEKVARIVRYRDDVLSGTGSPMLVTNREPFDFDMAEFDSRLVQLRETYLPIVRRVLDQGK